MKRFGEIAAAALIALLLALPLGPVSAQGGAPCAYGLPIPAFLFGTAMADGRPVEEGAVIVAMVGDELIGYAIVLENGEFGPLELKPPTSCETTVTFHLGARASSYTYEWMSGGREIIMLDFNRNMVVKDFPAPSNVIAANGENPGEALISWDAVDDAAYYRIGWIAYPDYVAVPEGQDWREAFVFVDVANRGQNERTITRLTPGVLYAFTVASNDNRYGEPQWSEWATLTLNAGAPCPAAEPEPQPTP